MTWDCSRRKISTSLWRAAKSVCRPGHRSKNSWRVCHRISTNLSFSQGKRQVQSHPVRMAETPSWSADRRPRQSVCPLSQKKRPSPRLQHPRKSRSAQSSEKHAELNARPRKRRKKRTSRLKNVCLTPSFSSRPQSCRRKRTRTRTIRQTLRRHFCPVNLRTWRNPTSFTARLMILS